MILACGTPFRRQVWITNFLGGSKLVGKIIKKQAEIAPLAHGLRLACELVVIRPSRDFGRLAGEFEPQLPWLFRHLTRSLGSRETASPDLLSLLMFQPDYIARLMEIGEADAEAEADRISELLV